MENASKAIIIAGSVLLLIAVLSFASYMWGRVGSQTSEFYEQLSQSDIDEFNQQFLNYNGKDDLTIQDVVSIINIAKNNNEKGKLPVTVIVNSNFEGNNLQEKSTSDLNSMLKKYIYFKDTDGTYKNTFSCTTAYATNSKLIGKITINKN